MRKAILLLLLAAATAFGQIETPITNGRLTTNLNADNKQVLNLDVTNLPLQPLNSNLTTIANGGVTSVGAALLSQPDLTALRAYVGATGTVVNTLASSSGIFLTGFDAGTGNFSTSAVTWSDVTGKPTPPSTFSSAANNFITNYDATTGIFASAQPSFANLSGTATSAQLPATITGRILDDTNTITAKDGSFLIENTATTSKKLAFNLANISASNTRTFTIPNTNFTGAVPLSAVSNQFITGLNSDGTFTTAQPAFSNISGIATSGQVPNLNGITAPTADVNLNGFRITNLAAALNAGDATSKTYVDTAVSAGVPPPHQSVAAATTGNIALTGEQVIDGVTTSASRVLVKDQTTASENGIYTTGAGGWTRVSDADAGSEIPGLIFVSGGTSNAYTGWAATTPLPITIGVTNLTYTQTSSVPQYTAGNGLLLSGTQFSAKGTAGRITIGAGGINLDPAYVGQSTITTVGTITSGTWTGDLIGAAYGGTGVNNSGKTLTLGGNMTTSGVTSLSGTNTGDVTLSGQGYITLTGQALTVNPVDLSTGNVTGTLAAARFPALTGDVTTTAGSLATTLANNSVTNAKLATMNANSIKGNNTGSTGAATDLTVSQAKTMMSLNNVENTALSTWPGSANVTTLGNVTSGTWNGTTVAIAKGGTGATTKAAALDALLPTGSNGQVLVKTGAGTQALKSIYRKVNLRTLTISGTYTPTAGTTEIYVECIGGGGGGAGAVASGVTAAAGGGGGGGAYAAKFYSSVDVSYSYTIGAGGAGGTGAANGSTGSDTSFGTTPDIDAGPGSGGAFMTAGTTAAFTSAFAGTGGFPSAGDLGISGSDGEVGTRLSAGAVKGGAGGGGGFKAGGRVEGATTDTNGTLGYTYGGGGSGAASLSTNSRTGGAGQPGVIYVTEYIATTAP